jgi:hypothetical protein
MASCGWVRNPSPHRIFHFAVAGVICIWNGEPSRSVGALMGGTRSRRIPLVLSGYFDLSAPGMGGQPFMPRSGLDGSE